MGSPKLLKKLVASDGVEPPTRGFSVFEFGLFDFGYVRLITCLVTILLVASTLDHLF